MIMDSKLVFATAAALSTAATGVANVGDVIDVATIRDLGQGRPVFLYIEITTAVTSGAAASVSFQLVSDSAAAISTTTQIVHLVTASLPKATLVAKFLPYTGAIPYDAGNPYKQFVGLQQNVVTTALTAGNITAFLSLEEFGWKSYPSANS